ncbi:MAG: hypothetical protein JSV88_31085 [Candidatus Aminicenantes bacterium]|nr:MAG: hypothetical protein JSV88_31085 [Candidatus Aminicenantes bacterium]
MKAKLTLTIDKDLLEEAKEYAKSSNLSLSTIVERYFQSLLEERQGQEKDQSSWGDYLPGMNHFDREFDIRDYTDYLIDEYQ